MAGALTLLLLLSLGTPAHPAPPRSPTFVATHPRHRRPAPRHHRPRRKARIPRVNPDDLDPISRI